jgi:hypothetical protein
MEPNPIITEMQTRHLADRLITREHNPNPSNKLPTEPFCSKAAARLLGVSIRTLSKMMVAGTVKFTKGPNRWDPVTFTYSDIGLKKPVETAIAAPQSDERKAPDITAPPKIAAAQQPAEPEPEPVSRETFRSSSGYLLSDPRDITLLGTHPFGSYQDDPRTNITHRDIRYYSGNGDGTKTGFKSVTGYGTSVEDLQQESDYYKTHRREARRRYGPR